MRNLTVNSVNNERSGPFDPSGGDPVPSGGFCAGRFVCQTLCQPLLLQTEPGLTPAVSQSIFPKE